MKRFRVWIGLGLSGIFIWLALRQVKDFGVFVSAFQGLKIWALGLGILGYFVVFLFRAWRWHYILLSQMRLKFSSSFIGLIICYMANNLLPLRAGELVRAVVVARREKKSFSPVFATVVLERVFDSLAIIFFLAMTLLWIEVPEQFGDLRAVMRKGGIAGLALALVLIMVLYGFYYFQDNFLNWTKILTKPFGKKIQEFVLKELEKFAQGLVILGKPSRILVVMMMSLLVWLVNLIPIWAVGIGFGVRFGFMDCLLLVVLGAFSASIPAAPGFWGTFHWITSEGIKFLGVLSLNQALAYAIVLHSFYFFPSTLLGLILLWREGYTLGELENKAEQAQPDLEKI